MSTTMLLAVVLLYWGSTALSLRISCSAAMAQALLEGLHALLDHGAVAYYPGCSPIP